MSSRTPDALRFSRNISPRADPCRQYSRHPGSSLINLANNSTVAQFSQREGCWPESTSHFMEYIKRNEGRGLTDFLCQLRQQLIRSIFAAVPWLSRESRPNHTSPRQWRCGLRSAFRFAENPLLPGRPRCHRLMNHSIRPPVWHAGLLSVKRVREGGLLERRTLARCRFALC